VRKTWEKDWGKDKGGKRLQKSSDYAARTGMRRPRKYLAAGEFPEKHQRQGTPTVVESRGAKKEEKIKEDLVDL